MHIENQTNNFSNSENPKQEYSNSTINNQTNVYTLLKIHSILDKPRLDSKKFIQAFARITFLYFLALTFFSVVWITKETTLKDIEPLLILHYFKNTILTICAIITFEITYRYLKHKNFNNKFRATLKNMFLVFIISFGIATLLSVVMAIKGEEFSTRALMVLVYFVAIRYSIQDILVLK